VKPDLRRFYRSRTPGRGNEFDEIYGPRFTLSPLFPRDDDGDEEDEERRGRDEERPDVAR